MLSEIPLSEHNMTAGDLFLYMISLIFDALAFTAVEGVAD